MCSLCWWSGGQREISALRWETGLLWPQWSTQSCRRQVCTPWGSEPRVGTRGQSLPIFWDAPPTAGFCSCLLSAGQPTTKNKRQFSTHESHQTHFIMCASDRECQNCQRIPSDRTTTCMTGFNSSPCSHLCVPLRLGCVSTLLWYKLPVI